MRLTESFPLFLILYFLLIISIAHSAARIPSCAPRMITTVFLPCRQFQERPHPDGALYLKQLMLVFPSPALLNRLPSRAGRLRRVLRQAHPEVSVPIVRQAFPLTHRRCRPLPFQHYLSG